MGQSGTYPALLVVAGMATLLVFAVPHRLPAQNSSRQSPCDTPEARQFDFWAGEWDVYVKGKKGGFNHISVIHNGCTLLEEYHAVKGPYEGKSFNYYDPSDKRWHQVWVDNGGTRLHLTGGWDGKSMVMSGERKRGTERVVDRITWTPGEGGSVRQRWDLSKDGGKTFTTIFDGVYRPHKPQAK